MISRILLLLSTLFLFSQCFDDHSDVDLSAIKRESKIIRFDQAFFSSDSSNMEAEIDRLAAAYPEFFSGGTNPVFWKSQRRDERQLALYQRVQEVFDNEEALNENLNFSMKHFYHYFPQSDKIKFYGYISNLDFEYPVLYADSVCFIGLDLYLGPGQKFYSELPRYMAFYRQPGFMIRDVMEAVINPRVAPTQGNSSLLDDMVYHGRILYLLEQMMPQKEREIIIKYTPEELQFCRDNERTIWSYFIEHNYLFNTGTDLKRRFIQLAPFSKFRMKFDAETPGMIGRWVGWQIVRSYMENNEDISLAELAQERDARKILKLSGYKP